MLRNGNKTVSQTLSKRTSQDPENGPLDKEDLCDVRCNKTSPE